jgi:hypothetical protein
MFRETEKNGSSKDWRVAVKGKFGMNPPAKYNPMADKIII